MYTSLPRGVPRCQHIKVNGTRCDSPALKGKPYCYFHFRSRLAVNATAAPAPMAEGRQPIAAPANDQRLTTNNWSPLSPPADLFTLEDANSIQCALQWVLRRILDASIDQRQASLLLYGLQIAAANIKRTRFRPSYGEVIRALPTDPPAEGALEKASTSSNCHPELGRDEPIPVRANGPASLPTQATPPASGAAESVPSEVEAPAPARGGRPHDSRQDAGATRTLPAFSLLSADPQPSTIAEGREPTAESSKLPTDHCPPTTIAVIPPRSNKPSRRPRATSLPIDHRPLTTARPALSQMFQREVRRHLARLNFPASPDSDPED